MQNTKRSISAIPAAIILSIFILAGCATKSMPTGGEKDTLPPQIDSVKSTPNYQVNFEKQNIEIRFDEWIEIRDIFNQVVISPPLEFEPEINQKGRGVRFEFAAEEVLRENATYTINFGDAIRDYNEGNVAENLRFVFSTGPFLDSLTVTGKVVDAYTLEPLEDILVMMYDNYADSVVRTKRPFYFSKTDESGQFTINNVKNGYFKSFALKDNNLNYLYDLSDEAIGFIDSLTLVSDSLSTSLYFKLFLEKPPFQLMTTEADEYGFLKLGFNQSAGALTFDYQDIGQQIFSSQQKDTLKIWYHQPADSSWKLYLNLDTLFRDTIKVKGVGRKAFLEDNTIPVHEAPSKSQPTFKPSSIAFNHPISKIDTASIALFEDTLTNRLVPTIQIDTLNPLQVTFTYKWKPGTSYRLALFPGALTDFYGLTNDSLEFSFKTLAPDQYGTLNVEVSNLNQNQYYLFQLLDEKEKNIEDRWIKGDSSLALTYRLIPPGIYKIRVIEDLNQNKEWDPGNYDLKQPPEKVYLKTFENLRANWELRALVDWNEAALFSSPLRQQPLKEQPSKED